MIDHVRTVNWGTTNTIPQVQHQVIDNNPINREYNPTTVVVYEYYIIILVPVCTDHAHFPKWAW